MPQERGTAARQRIVSRLMLERAALSLTLSDVADHDDEETFFGRDLADRDLNRQRAAVRRARRTLDDRSREGRNTDRVGREAGMNSERRAPRSAPFGEPRAGATSRSSRCGLSRSLGSHPKLDSTTLVSKASRCFKRNAYANARHVSRSSERAVAATNSAATTTTNGTISSTVWANA